MLFRSQDRSGVTSFPLHLLPRRCPLCGDDTIIGHGQRRKQAHDQCHDWIWVRRGICPPCSKTFTILPDWLAPSGHFSLRCRQQACESIAPHQFRHTYASEMLRPFPPW